MLIQNTLKFEKIIDLLKLIAYYLNSLWMQMCLLLCFIYTLNFFNVPFP